MSYLNIKGHDIMTNDFIQKDLEIGVLVGTAVDQDDPVLADQGQNLFYPVFYEYQPPASFKIVIVA